MAQARFNLDDYSVRVLDVIKGKHGLKNRQEALNKFIRKYGEEYVEPLPDKNVLKELDEKYERHITKYGRDSKGMTEKELDELLGLKE